MPETTMKWDFTDRVVFITGAASGIGREIALAFSAAGARVALADLNLDQARQVAAAIEQQGGAAFALALDVRDGEQIRQAIQHTVGRWGRLDAAVNCAGVEGSRFIPTADYEQAVWDQVIAINLSGVWLSMKYEIQAMLPQQRGVIVNLASLAGLIGGKIGAGYYASKHGVVGLTRAAAVEYASLGIRVNAVCPSVIPTPMVERLSAADPEFAAWVAAQTPLGRLGTTAEVAQTVLYLCSDAASFITGHALPVDGGRYGR
ncbi:MAG: SDR family oxidoreductase [Gammaproteobacteria bacterium]